MPESCLKKILPKKLCHKFCHQSTLIGIEMFENNFYKKAAYYWSKVPATIDGVLGGFGQISDTDIEGSKAFLHKILTSQSPPGTKLALDCGAGIGRITKYVLVPCFEIVELVEQNEKFIKAAKQFLCEDNMKLGTMYTIGLQHFKPQKKYDIIWCQWVLGHLKDYDLISFLGRCRDNLEDNGVIVVKENITTSNVVEYDNEDSSVTRPRDQLKRIFVEANLKIIENDIQPDFPEDIYPVHTYALRPIIK